MKKLLDDCIGEEPHKVCHHRSKFGGHRYCGGGDITVSVCHKISEDYMIKKPCDIIGRSPSR